MKTQLQQHLVQRFAKPPYRGAAGFLVAVSGGVDSMVLLDVVLRLRHIHGATPRVFHCDHRTGRFSDQSRRLVQETCARLGLPLREVVFTEPVGANFEYRAAAFRRTQIEAALLPDEVALLAHHAADQMETMLLALSRGARVASPVAMAAERDRRLRPLLDVDRGMILDHAATAGVAHVLDPSNYDRGFQRNYLRHEVVPRLAEGHDKPWLRWQRWAASFSQLQHQLHAAAGEVLAAYWQSDGLPRPLLQREWYAATPPYLHEFVLAQSWSRFGCPPPINRHHEQLITWLAQGRIGSFEHEGGVAYCDQDGLTWWPKPPSETRFVPWDTSFEWGPWCWRLRRPEAHLHERNDKLISHALRTMALLSGRPVSRLPGNEPPLSFVNWHESDGLFVSLPNGVGRRIKEWYRTEQVPHRLRRLLPQLSVNKTGTAIHVVDVIANHPDSVLIEPRP